VAAASLGVVVAVLGLEVHHVVDVLVGDEALFDVLEPARRGQAENLLHHGLECQLGLRGREDAFCLLFSSLVFSGRLGRP
jgi:hypothetical protein